jgi:hypothetical protein
VQGRPRQSHAPWNRGGIDPSSLTHLCERRTPPESPAGLAAVSEAVPSHPFRGRPGRFAAGTPPPATSHEVWGEDSYARVKCQENRQETTMYTSAAIR